MVTSAQPKLKSTKPAVAKKPKSSPSHPPFAEMITDAIVSLKERTGSSQYAITKFIEEKHKQLPPNFRKLLLYFLKKSVAAGKLVKVKNSFKVPPTRSAPTKKPTDAKPAKAPSKPSAKTASKPQPKASAKAKVAAKPKTATKSKAAAASAKAAVGPAKVAQRSAKTSLGKKVVKAAKSVKKPKSVKSPVKKAVVKKAKK